MIIARIVIQAPARNFVISKITNEKANKHLSKGHSSVCAFGVGFFRDGHRVHVAHGRPSVKLLFTGDPISSADHLYVLIPGGATLKDATVTTHQVTSTLRRLRELDIVRGS